jgi:hypothetical protein
MRFAQCQDPALRHGHGLGPCRHFVERRDRLWLLDAFAIALLTRLGAAGEADDRLLKSNTSKRRSHSLFRQGCMIYRLIPTMPEKWLGPITEKFAALLADVPVFSRTYGLI